MSECEKTPTNPNGYGGMIDPNPYRKMDMTDAEYIDRLEEEARRLRECFNVIYVRRLERENEELRKELARVRTMLNDWQDTYGGSPELAELRKDRERLDYLGSSGALLNALDTKAISWGKTVRISDEVGEWMTDTVRQAIDAAMQENRTDTKQEDHA